MAMLNNQMVFRMFPAINPDSMLSSWIFNAARAPLWPPAPYKRRYRDAVEVHLREPKIISTLSETPSIISTS